MKRLMGVFLVLVFLFVGIVAVYPVQIHAAEPLKVTGTYGPTAASEALFFIDVTMNGALGNLQNAQATADASMAAVKQGVREKIKFNGKPLQDYLAAGDYAVMVHFYTNEYGNTLEIVADKQYLDIRPETAFTIELCEGLVSAEGNPIAPVKYKYDPAAVVKWSVDNSVEEKNTSDEPSVDTGSTDAVTKGSDVTVDTGNTSEVTGSSDEAVDTGAASTGDVAVDLKESDDKSTTQGNVGEKAAVNEESRKNPDTGDAASVVPFAIALFSIAGCSAAGLKLKKRNN